MMSKEYNHVRDLFRGGQGVVQLFNHWPTHQDRAIKRSFGGLSMDLRSGKFVSALPFARYGIPVLEVLSDTEYAMPYYDYPLLAKITNANTAKRSEDLVWTCELALKLALHIYFLHDRTMAPHGDLTPSNILVGRREPNEPWWTSFLTKAASADMIALPTLLKEFDSNFATDRSVVVIDPWCFDSSYDRGVPPNFSVFNAPESAEKNSRMTVAADIYAFGKLLWYMLTGSQPTASPLGSIRRFNRIVPIQFDQIVSGCVQNDPTWRLTPLDLVKSMIWAVNYLNANGEFAYFNTDANLLPPRPTTIQKTFAASPALKVCGRPVAIQQLSAVVGTDVKELKFEFVGNTNQYRSPEGIAEASKDWITDCVRHFAYKRRETLRNTFFNGEQVRIDQFTQKRDDSIVNVKVSTSYTSFFDSQMTNYFCNRFLEDGRTVWQAYAGREKSLSDSLLSNPLALNFLVVTKDQQIAVARRALNLSITSATDKDAELPLVPTVSGTCSPSKCCTPTGLFDLTTAVATEYQEEVLNKHVLNASHILPLGLARTTGFLWPFIYGVIFCDRSSKDLDSGTRISADGLQEIDSFEFVDDSCVAISEYINRVLNRKRDPGQRPRRIEDALLFCLYRYSQWKQVQESINQEDFDKLFN